MLRPPVCLCWSEATAAYTLGTMGTVVNQSLYGYEDAQFSDWMAQGVDSHLRDSPVRDFHLRYYHPLFSLGYDSCVLRSLIRLADDRSLSSADELMKNEVFTRMGFSYER